METPNCDSARAY